MVGDMDHSAPSPGSRAWGCPGQALSLSHLLSLGLSLPALPLLTSPEGKRCLPARRPTPLHTQTPAICSLLARLMCSLSSPGSRAATATGRTSSYSHNELRGENILCTLSPHRDSRAQTGRGWKQFEENQMTRQPHQSNSCTALNPPSDTSASRRCLVREGKAGHGKQRHFRHVRHRTGRTVGQRTPMNNSFL